VTDPAIRKARQLIARYKTCDPFEIAAAVGIREIVYEKLDRLKGMYTCIKRNRFIVINDSLNEYWRKLICAHELGHDQLHRNLAINKWLQEFMIYDMSHKPEYEANIFAAEILIPDERIRELSGENTTVEQVAKTLCLDVNLVALKMAALMKRRFDYNYNFLKQRSNAFDICDGEWNI
jgi:Zn-dependent peptidase ImmA (M78 family)